MISIRPEQMSALDASVRERFIGRMVEHLRRCFPERCAASSDADMRQRISRAMDRAAQYEIRRERDLGRFLDVGMIFGETFDTDCPWATAVLGQPIDPSARMKILFEDARRRAQDLERG
jgi:hypothetical protein